MREKKIVFKTSNHKINKKCLKLVTSNFKCCKTNSEMIIKSHSPSLKNSFMLK